MRNQRTYRLVNTESPWAWFVDVDDLDNLHTDDWDDAHRMATVYKSDKYDLLMVAFDGPLEDSNMDYSNEEILAAELSFLKTRPWADEVVRVPAKATLEEFVELVHEADGEVYLPESWERDDE